MKNAIYNNDRLLKRAPWGYELSCIRWRSLSLLSRA